MKPTTRKALTMVLTALVAVGVALGLYPAAEPCPACPVCPPVVAEAPAPVLDPAVIAPVPEAPVAPVEE